MNLYQVLKSEDLDEIILTNPNKLIVCMFSSKNCPPCVKIKPIFIDYSKKHLDMFFVYVDVMFEDKENKYLNHIEVTPMFLFFFNASVIANMKGSDDKLLETIILDLKNKIEVEFNRIQQELLEQQEHQKEENKAKINILKQLANLESSGVSLTQDKVFNMDMSISDLQEELNLHTKPINKYVEPELENNDVHENNSNETYSYNSSKQEKIKRIQELNKLSHVKQMEQLKKLQQLKRLQKQKEIN